MMLLGIFIGELLFLFFLSQQLTKSLSLSFHYFFRNQTVAIQLLSVLFLPGVIVHELSHLLTASIFFVPTGEIEFLPEIHGDEVKMGSVSIARTDPLRRFLIGVAPLLAGLGLLFLLFWYFVPSLTLFSWQTLLLLYAVFEVSNTMFSSRKDMEGAIGLFVLFIALIALLYIAGINVGAYIAAWMMIGSVSSLFLSMVWYLGIAVVLDSATLLLTKGALHVQKRY